jgi:hypothetical protein
LPGITRKIIKRKGANPIYLQVEQGSAHAMNGKPMVIYFF